MTTTNEEFWAEVASLIKPLEPLVIEYRLHYNDLGEIYCCTMQQHPEATNYVVTNKVTYEQYYNYRVVEGRLSKITHNSQYQVRLKKADHGYCVVGGHAGLILESNETYQDTEYYARTN